jgi:NET1-associated nuclear protein 1 (U3 small nucleolar RNA-associated protein 17)
MAGSKTTKAAREDKTKKRKRDTVEANKESKRHRKDRKGAQHQEKTNDTHNIKATSENGPEPKNIQLATRQTTTLQPVEKGNSGWKVSKAMGGRMLDIDPILTRDEKYVALSR